MKSELNEVRNNQMCSGTVVFARLAVFGTDDYKDDAAKEGDGAYEGRDEYCVLGFVGDSHGAEVDVLLPMTEGEASGEETNDAEEDEKKSQDECKLHG